MQALLLFLTLLATSHFPRERVSVLLLRLELARFPSRAECAYWLARADKHLAWIDGRIRLFPHQREAWQAYRSDVVVCRNAWSSLHFARLTPQWPSDWYRLAELREAIGDHYYRLGYIPVPIAAELLDLPGVGQ